MAQIWIPSSADPGDRYRAQTFSLDRTVITRCTVVVSEDGDLCGMPFYEGEEWKAEQHTVMCSKRHEGEIRAFMARRRPEIMKPWDPEYRDWLDSNRRGIAEGRVRW